MKKILLNLAIFQIGWLVCVAGGDLYAVIFTGLALIIHHWLIVGNPSEWRLIAMVALVGCLWDIAMAQSGVIRYGDALPVGIPLWLVCLWLLFATTFMHGLFWLSRFIWLAVIFAAVMGPASYWTGTHLSDAELGLPIMTSVAIMALGWALLFPFGIYYAGKMKS